jgi:DNA invertase Pin-like site-specific DNA recombinase
MKAYLLARVSTDDQKDALPAQTIKLKDYAIKKAYDYELFEIQESAYKGDRQVFRAIVDKTGLLVIRLPLSIFV